MEKDEKPTVEEAFAFAKSVMGSKDGAYSEPKTPEDALRQLYRQRVDLSESMAFEKLQRAGVTLDE